jgi:hypothetical protein
MTPFDQKIDIAHGLIPERQIRKRKWALVATQLSLRTDNSNANSGIVIESLPDTSAIMP